MKFQDEKQFFYLFWRLRHVIHRHNEFLKGKKNRSAQQQENGSQALKKNEEKRKKL